MISSNEDYYAWTPETIAKLRQGKFGEIDIEHLVEAIEDMGKSERRELKNRLSVLLAHLLKWQYQPDQISRSREATITEQRLEIADLLEENPSLKSEVKNTLEKSYKIGIQKGLEYKRRYTIQKTAQ